MMSEQPLASLSTTRSTWRPVLSVWQRFMCEWLVIGCLGVAIVSICVFTQLSSNFDRLVYDRLVTLDSKPLSSDIAMVSIDDDSIFEQGRWPWPRSLQARLIEAVTKAGAAAIVYDVLLTEPGQGDEVLARALRETPTYLPLLVDPRPNGQVVQPVSALAAAAAASGHIDVVPDPDGIVRGVSLRESAGGASWPYIVSPLYDDIRSGKISIAGGRYRGDPKPSILSAAASSDGAFERNQSRVLIPFSTELPSKDYISARALLDGEAPADALRGKIVFVGLTASGLMTHLATPISGQLGPTADMVLHANVLNALLKECTIREADSHWLLASSLGPLAVLLAGFLFFSPWRTLLLTFALSLF